MFVMLSPLNSSTSTCLDPIPWTINSILHHVHTLPIANRATIVNAITTRTARAPHVATMTAIDTNVTVRAHRSRNQ
jgi:hypothetical protein